MMVMLEFKKGANINWRPDEESNRIFIKWYMEKFSNWLNYRGYIFLSEILAGIGYPFTRYSITAGWKKGDSFEYGLVNIGADFKVYLDVPHDDIRDVFAD